MVSFLRRPSLRTPPAVSPHTWATLSAVAVRERVPRVEPVGLGGGRGDAGLLKSHADITSLQLPTHLPEVTVKRRLTFSSVLSVEEDAGRSGTKTRVHSETLEDPSPPRNNATHRVHPENLPGRRVWILERLDSYL